MPDNNLFEIQARITAARQTRKITRTMELIASSRLQRGKLTLAHYQEWAARIRGAARCLPDACFDAAAKPCDRDAYVVFGGKKGLSGAYSPNLLQYARPVVSGHTVLAVGSAAEAFFPDARCLLGDEFPSADSARAVARAAREVYARKEAGAVYLVYARGIGHVTEQLYPLRRGEGHDNFVLVEPSPRALVQALLDEYAEAIVYEAYLQAFLAEQIARVAAMDSATRNADDIIAALQASYNRIRQAAITQEILTVGNAAKGG